MIVNNQNFSSRRRQSTPRRKDNSLASTTRPPPGVRQKVGLSICPATTVALPHPARASRTLIQPRNMKGDTRPCADTQLSRAAAYAALSGKSDLRTQRARAWGKSPDVVRRPTVSSSSDVNSPALIGHAPCAGRRSRGPRSVRICEKIAMTSLISMSRARGAVAHEISRRPRLLEKRATLRAHHARPARASWPAS